MVLLTIHNVVLQIEIYSFRKSDMDSVQNMRLLNLEHDCTGDAAVLHFSIDDVIEIFRDLTENQDRYQSVFENDTLRFLKNLHDKYGMCVTLYCFFDFSGFSLAECTDRFAEEFTENKEWLKFGFHAYDSESYMDIDTDHLCEYYQLVSEQLMRITGCEESDLSKVLRLDRFCGTKDQLIQLDRQFGIEAFLTADDGERESYYLGKEELKLLAMKDFYIDENRFFTPTDIRLEEIRDTKELNDILAKHQKDKNLVIFTHEWKLNQKVETLICQTAEFCISRQYRFSNELNLESMEQ